VIGCNRRAATKNLPVVQTSEKAPRQNVDEPRDGDGLTPLAKAAERGDLGEVRRLVKLGADVNAIDSYDRDVLSWAGAPEVVVFLIDHGADPDAVSGTG